MMQEVKKPMKLPRQKVKRFLKYGLQKQMWDK